MGIRSPEGGDKPGNQGLSDFKVLREQKGVSPRIQKPEEPKQQPADPELDAASQLHKKPSESVVFKGPFRVPRPLPQNPGQQRGEAEQFQPKPAEQQTPQRRRTQRELARLAQDPELRSLADELWGKGFTKGGLTEVIKTALYRYPDLPPDEALRRDRNDYQGFSFA